MSNVVFVIHSLCLVLFWYENWGLHTNWYCQCQQHVHLNRHVHKYMNSDMFIQVFKLLFCLWCSQATEIKHIKIFRFDAALFFANSEYFKTTLYKMTVDPNSLKKLKKKSERELRLAVSIPSTNHLCCMVCISFISCSIFLTVISYMIYMMHIPSHIHEKFSIADSSKNHRHVSFSTLNFFLSQIWMHLSHSHQSDNHTFFLDKEQWFP